MFIKTKFISLIILLSFFISSNGLGNKFSTPLKCKAEVQQSVSESQDPAGEETIINIKDILHSIVRKTGTNHHYFRFLKNNKKSTVASLSHQDLPLLNAHQLHYEKDFTNNINHPPFYIAYHRLLI